MESEFGTYFLSNYRSAPWAESLSALEDAKETQTPVLAPAAACPPLAPGTAAPAAPSAPAGTALPPLQRLCESESTATPGSSGLFRLAPPPPPTNQFSVGATRTSTETVVKIETLQEQKAAATTSKTQELEDYGPTGAVFVDDEESLLGDDAPKTGGAAGQKHTRDLDSDVEVDEADLASPGAKVQAAPHLDPPVELPPPQALSPAEAEPEEVEAEEEELEEKPIETANGIDLHVSLAPPQEAPVQPPRPDTVHDDLPVAPDTAPDTAGAFAAAETPAEASFRPILPGHVQTFRISVPQPFPGVQLRKSPNIDDKRDRFLQDGKEVRGKVDATGEWVKLKREHYLPVKVGQIQVLHPVETPEEPVPASPEVPPVTVEEDPSSFWWTCCAGSAVIASIEANDLHVAPQDRASEREHEGLEGEMPVSPVVANKMVTGGAPVSKAPTSLRPEAHTVVDLPRHISHPIDPFSDR